MFVYRLLERIGAGPKVLFPFYAASTYIHFIATEEVCEFKELDQLEDVSEQKKVVVEAYLLFLILGIRDLHQENIGLDLGNNLSIIDFYLPDTDLLLRRNIFDDFKNENRYESILKAHDILSEIGQEERLKIAKDALPRWSQINSITSDIIGIEMSELYEQGVKFMTTPPTDLVDGYLEDIKVNYTTICSAVL
uniref:PI3K/PI4K domain-containing protein n=1 Tax=Caenorhabditis tropicalis TaxID=1561998 RepID=A0A1I7TJ21_9PELO